MIRALNSTFVNATKCLFAAIPLDHLFYKDTVICGFPFKNIFEGFYSKNHCNPEHKRPMLDDEYKNCDYYLGFAEISKEYEVSFNINDGSDLSLTRMLGKYKEKPRYKCIVKKCNDVIKYATKYITTKLTSAEPTETTLGNLGSTESEYSNTASNTSRNYTLVNNTISDIINYATEYVTTKLTGVESTETTLGNPGYIESEYSNTASNISGNYTLVNNTTNKLNQTIDSNLDIDLGIGGAIIAYIALGSMLAYTIYKFYEARSEYNNKIAQGQDFMLRSDGCTNYNHQHDNYEDNISFSIISESEENSICTGNISCNIIEASVDSANC